MSNSKSSTTSRSRLPLHIAVSEMLAREIKAGVLLEGEKLEPERVMAKKLDIAVGTLRKALSDLHEKGLLERVQGSGNYVRNPQETSTIYGFFRLELLKGGGLPSATTLSLDLLDGSSNEVSALTDSLNFSEQQTYYRIRRLRYLSDIGVALEEIWLDASYASKPLSLDSMSDSLYQLYREQLGFWIASVEDNLSVGVPPAWRPEDFCNDASDTWGYVERRSWDQLGKQAEYSRTWFDCASARYVARWK